MPLGISLPLPPIHSLLRPAATIYTRITPKSPNHTRITPKSPNYTRITPKSPNYTNTSKSQEITPKSQNHTRSQNFTRITPTTPLSPSSSSTTPCEIVLLIVIEGSWMKEKEKLFVCLFCCFTVLSMKSNTETLNWIEGGPSVDIGNMEILVA